MSLFKIASPDFPAILNPSIVQSREAQAELDLKDLRYFRVVVESGTISKAAAHLRVAQPAISRKLQKLEHELGVQLLRRTARGVTPTEAGQVLLQRAIGLQQDIEETRRDVARYADRPTGALRVAVQSPLSQIMMPELLRAYRATYPEMVLELTEGFSGDLIDGLLQGEMDVAVVDMPSHPHADLKQAPLWVETLRLVCPAGGAAAFPKGYVPVAELATLPLIMPCRKHAIRRLVDAAFERQRLRFHPVQEANGAPMIFELVKAGFGYTLMPPSGIYPWIVSGDLEAVALKPEIRRTISVVSRAALMEDRAVSGFWALVKALAPTIAGMERLGPAKPYLEAAMPARHRARAHNKLAGRLAVP